VEEQTRKRIHDKDASMGIWRKSDLSLIDWVLHTYNDTIQSTLLSKYKHDLLEVKGMLQTHNTYSEDSVLNWKMERKAKKDAKENSYIYVHIT